MIAKKKPKKKEPTLVERRQNLDRVIKGCGEVYENLFKDLVKVAYHFKELQLWNEEIGDLNKKLGKSGKKST